MPRRRREESECEAYRVTTPTATETMLPWKRQDDYDSVKPVQQNEFPAWCSNKEYLAYNSPSATFLGNLLTIFLSVFKLKNSLFIMFFFLKKRWDRTTKS